MEIQPVRRGGRAMKANLGFLELRDRLLWAVREWFHSNGYLEVTTATLIDAPAPEPHIDCPRCGDGFLRASPELQMKKLMGCGADRIFQIGPCFRDGERGRLHNPEFTMLEWYRRGADASGILAETKGLIRHAVASAVGSTVVEYRGARCDVGGRWIEIGVADAYRQWAGWNPLENFDQDRFDEDMALKIEPSLPRDVPVALCGYPREAASLSKLNERDPRIAERWELYMCGVEIANAFGELTDGGEQRRRFDEARRERSALGEADYPLDEEFLSMLESGSFPECGGIAVGIDRLAMLACGAREIGEVMA